MSVTYLSNEKKPDYSLCVRVSVSNPCGKSVTMFFFKCYSFSNIVLRSAEQPCAWTQTKGHEVPNYSNHSKLCPQWLSWTKLRGGANLKSRTNVVCKPWTYWTVLHVRLDSVSWRLSQKHREEHNRVLEQKESIWVGLINKPPRGPASSIQSYITTSTSVRFSPEQRLTLSPQTPLSPNEQLEPAGASEGPLTVKGGST